MASHDKAHGQHLHKYLHDFCHKHHIVLREVDRKQYLTETESDMQRGHRIAISKDKKFIYKTQLTEYELQHHLHAGHCAVQIIGEMSAGNPEDPHEPRELRAIIMPVEEEFNYDTAKSWTDKVKAETAHEWVKRLTELHEKKIIFGDVKPENFLRVKESGRWVFCDFGEARTVGEHDKHDENFGQTEYYVSPKRHDTHSGTPEIEDDWYSMALSIWSIYTGELPPHIESDRPKKCIKRPGTWRAIDVNAIVDEKLREQARQWIIAGGGLA